MLGELDPRAAGAQRLAGKVCIVTGAGQGIGRATARRLAAEGGRIVVAERIAETAERTTRELQDAGAQAVAVLADVSRYDEAQRLMQESLEACGRIDVLVNVVGGTIWWKPFEAYQQSEIALELERSLMTTLWCCNAVLPIMIAQGSGSIVNLSSSVLKGGLYRVPYAVSKGGIEGLTKTLAAEVGRHGVRVNAVAPGSTAVPDRTTSRLTIRPGEVAPEAENTAALMKETRAQQLGALGRQGLPEEQAAAIAFLASEDASFVTGHIIDCSGGSR